jgi:hypothetical protein
MPRTAKNDYTVVPVRMLRSDAARVDQVARRNALSKQSVYRLLIHRGLDHLKLLHLVSPDAQPKVR